jgi:lysophospholipase L1-like esterase
MVITTYGPNHPAGAPLPTFRRMPIAVLLTALTTTGCAASTVAGIPGPVGSSGGSATLAPGPVTVIALGDSLTAGVGDDAGQGFVSRITDAIAAKPGREGSTLMNLGQSGWTSTELIDGQGAPGELKQAVDAARAAPPGSVLATVLIGSNDLWSVYQNNPVNPTPSADEDAAVATYRANLDRTVTEMQAAGAVVVVGLPDDQSVRPSYVDIKRLNEQLPDITEEEVRKMADLATVFDRTAAEVAAAHGVRTVDTNDRFWADPSKMDPDGIHPNATGYTEMATRWIQAVEPLL